MMERYDDEKVKLQQIFQWSLLNKGSSAFYNEIFFSLLFFLG